MNWSRVCSKFATTSTKKVCHQKHLVLVMLDYSSKHRCFSDAKPWLIVQQVRRMRMWQFVSRKRSNLAQKSNAGWQIHVMPRFLSFGNCCCEKTVTPSVFIQWIDVSQWQPLLVILCHIKKRFVLGLTKKQVNENDSLENRFKKTVPWILQVCFTV